jgi:triphosphoribosyl-dephospho-CoA synthase
MTALRLKPSVLLVDAAAAVIAGVAADCLLAEVETWPKPGLVSHVDRGSHNDMDADTFRRSVAATRPFYGLLAAAGADGAEMPELRGIGLDAERAMLVATGGVNTHRGAIFGLGLLCAAAGAAAVEGRPPSFVFLRCPAAVLGAVVRQRWGRAIAGGPIPLQSHGTQALRRFGAGGARAEAASGFQSVLDVGLPALRLGRRLAPGNPEAARVQAFFALLAAVNDTNLLHRGGADGLRYAQEAAAGFLAAGGVGQPGWLDAAVAVHRGFVERRLSPGGCADLLAATLFIDRMETGI